MMRGQMSGFANGPKTNGDPTNAKSRIRVITAPAAWNACRPHPIFRTISANRNCSVIPHATVR